MKEGEMVPVDLYNIKTKVAFNLTKRQLICFGLAGVIGIPVFILTKGAIGRDLAALLMVVVMLPCFFIALYEKNGVKAEKLFAYVIRHKFLSKKHRYKTHTNVVSEAAAEYVIKECLENGNKAIDNKSELKRGENTGQ